MSFTGARNSPQPSYLASSHRAADPDQRITADVTAPETESALIRRAAFSDAPIFAICAVTFFRSESCIESGERMQTVPSSVAISTCCLVAWSCSAAAAAAAAA